MLLIYFFAGFISLIGGFLGHHPLVFRLEKINKSNSLNSGLAVAFVFTLLMTAYYVGYFPHTVAAPFMIFIYSFLAGFFTGYAWRLFQLRVDTGHILYMHRSFWIDHAPTFAAILIILYGLYRTSLLLEQPVTGIRMASGLSLIAFGFFGLTLKIIPEFRSGGVLFLDRVIPWRQIMGWSWQSEEIINIEYLHKPGEAGEQVRELLTTIPLEDRKQIETVLESKMDEHRDERRKMLLDNRE
ncbi:MAG: hypothetical protein WEC12_05640 [Balneolaceae bacterium]